jgi:hypothetical protein
MQILKANKIYVSADISDQIAKVKMTEDKTSTTH